LPAGSQRYGLRDLDLSETVFINTKDFPIDKWNCRAATERVGREINPSTLTFQEFRQRIRKGDHFLTRVIDSPKLFVIETLDEFGKVVGESLAAEAQESSNETGQRLA
jgi:hypothetical protein